MTLTIKKTLILSVLFHAGLLAFFFAIVLNQSTHPFHPPVYQVDLVTLPPAAPAAEVKEIPAAPPLPPVKKPPAARPKAEVKEPPPKPIEPVAAVPPPVKSKETPPTVAKPSEAVSAIPSPAAKVEAGIEVPDFKYPYYLNLIQRKIETYWSPPPLESASEMKETVVGFVLSANGKIEDPRIEKSSGNAFFDQAALRAIYQSNPLPPFPQGIRDPSLKIHFSFSLMKKS